LTYRRNKCNSNEYASDASNGIMEYVVTFPNVIVNAGDEYKACVLPAPKTFYSYLLIGIKVKPPYF
jgi:hypothetical protein